MFVISIEHFADRLQNGVSPRWERSSGQCVAKRQIKLAGDNEGRANRVILGGREATILVVIPVFNRCDMVVEALDSVAAQTLKPSQVIVVDDGSTDRTAAAVEAWIGQRPNLNVELIRQTNQGASVARNSGFAARGRAADFVAFLDSDDLWPDDFLQRAAMGLKTNRDAIMAVADRVYVDVGGRPPRFVCSRLFASDPFLQIIRMGAGYGSATLMVANAFEATGGYPVDVPTGHDIVLFEKLSAIGKVVHNTGKPVTMRTWAEPANAKQEPHLHLRYPDRFIRWAETYLAVCQERATRPHINSRRELLYHAAIAYRFLLAMALEIVRLQPRQVLRVLKNLAQLGFLTSKNLVKLLTFSA